MFVEIKISDRKDKKLKAIFYDDEGDKKKVVHFGSKGSSTYIDHKDDKIKKNWEARHSKIKGIDYSNPFKASTLSKYILWNKKNLRDSVADYKKRFKLK